MSAAPAGSWLAVLATLALVLLYEVVLVLLQRRRPGQVARSAHAGLREDWFLAVSAASGSEVLAVQTLRNSLMSATMLASTAALALMGTVTLAAPSLHAIVDQAATVAPLALVTPRLLLELVLLSLLFASLVSTLMAVRFYNHAGFIGGMPVGSEARLRWTPLGVRYVRKAGLLYGFGLRQLVLVAPVVAAMLHPFAGPVAALVVAWVLYAFDRVARATEPQSLNRRAP
ncbi:MAG: DUF599 domain-containing protein [Variovorax paradoxus]|nr:MAG: DUF599 domain-containing protein [Variovorax paradoxus]PZQ04488.1 MAG: DUF599 domain-containing protein [Variovorax paradoxus]